ncbi:hypothetical protein BJV77DRAFT_989709, partial [Russula vinacea]
MPPPTNGKQRRSEYSYKRSSGTQHIPMRKTYSKESKKINQSDLGRIYNTVSSVSWRLGVLVPSDQDRVWPTLPVAAPSECQFRVCYPISSLPIAILTSSSNRSRLEVAPSGDDADSSRCGGSELASWPNGGRIPIEGTRCGDCGVEGTSSGCLVWVCILERTAFKPLSILSASCIILE